MAIESHSGGCHCGRIRFNVQADLAEVLECNCSICVKKGILHVIVPKEDFELLSGRDDLVLYQFNTNIAKHLFCGVCGIHSFYVPRSNPDKIDVNVNRGTGTSDLTATDSMCRSDSGETSQTLRLIFPA